LWNLLEFCWDTDPTCRSDVNQFKDGYKEWHDAYTTHEERRLVGHQEEESALLSSIPNEYGGKPDVSTPESGPGWGSDPASPPHVDNVVVSDKRTHATDTHDLEQRDQEDDTSDTSSSDASSSETIEEAGREVDVSIPESEDTEAPIEVTTTAQVDESHDTEHPLFTIPESETTVALIKATEGSFGIIVPLSTIR
jgi:hypothetical protein